MTLVREPIRDRYIREAIACRKQGLLRTTDTRNKVPAMGSNARGSPEGTGEMRRRQADHFGKVL
jgi:hypothetical protein